MYNLSKITLRVDDELDLVDAPANTTVSKLFNNDIILRLDQLPFD